MGICSSFIEELDQNIFFFILLIEIRKRQELKDSV